MKSYSVIWPRQNESLSLSLSDWLVARPRIPCPKFPFVAGRYTFLCDVVKEEWMDGWMDAVFFFLTWALCVRACVRQRERDKNRSCVRVPTLTCKVESRELVSPFFFCFLVSGRFVSFRFVSVVRSFLPNFSLLLSVFVFVLFREGRLSVGVILPLTSHLFLPYTVSPRRYRYYLLPR